MKACKFIPLLALTATLAAPLAFAQSTTPTQSADPAAASAATAPAAKTKTWADVDSNKDGKISKAESSSEPAVGQIFEQADADKDGNLTTDEYKAFVAKANGAAQGGQGG